MENQTINKKPIITVIYPTDHMSPIRRIEFLASQRNILNNEFNSNGFEYHILVFESSLNAPIFEIHNNIIDSSNSVELLKERINKILEFSKPKENLMTLEELTMQRMENSFKYKLKKFFS